ncbi:MAG TPA: ubiquinone biosynthesis protein [Planctomycetaceae bacterium]|nr:ubiquinone biosynthesis protein [Planctomycetaceae bacterium]
MALNPIRFFRNLGRTREIVSVLLNHGFGDLVQRLRLSQYLGWWRRRVLHRPEPGPPLTVYERVRMVLEELGPTFIKFGQVMSTRPDLVPAGMIAELEKLQDRVPPFPSAEAVRLLQEQLGGEVTAVFSRFDLEPLAAGSLGQVHRAVRLDGTEVAVKIRRPNVVRDVERDLSLMNELAALIEAHVPEAEPFDPVGLVSQFARSIRRELNFSREGRTIEEFQRLFRHDATLRVPRVFWDQTTESVLTMEFLGGVKISDGPALREAGYEPATIAANGARIFMKMAFDLGVFHGDPHPGNLKVLPGGVIGLIDFGMVGRLEQEKREQIVDLLAAVAQGDAGRCVNQMLLIGKPFRPVDQALLRADVRDFIDAYYGVPLDRIDVGNLLQDFVAVLAGHGIRYPADLMLLIRAIVTLEGVGRDLDPGFNLAEHLRPFAEQMLTERYSPGRMAARTLDDLRSLLAVAHDMPGHVGRTLQKLSQDDLRIQLEHRHLEHLITELDRSSNRLVTGLVMSALIVASALVLRTTGPSAWWLGAGAFVLFNILGLWLIVGIFRSGRL